MQFITFERKTGQKSDIDFLGLAHARQVQKFHRSFPGYEPTPLISLEHLARKLGISRIFVKDESYRLGLNAFKALGGSFAIGRFLANNQNIDLDALSFDALVSQDTQSKSGNLTFITATDGNHGRGIAWTAKQLNQKAVVYMPQGSSVERLNAIKALGADAQITDLNYDDTVRLAFEHAKQKGWILVQDTAWEGYEEIPKTIMQGYTTLLVEAYEQMCILGDRPTHIFIQAGVGSLAAAVQGFFAGIYGDDRPITVVVESDQAECIFRTAKAADGQLHFVTGALDTMMAGLACGEPSVNAWPILRDYTDGFLSCSDDISAEGMRILGQPFEGDVTIISGESGAVGVGAITEILRNPDYAHIKKALQLTPNSKILCFNTEGATDTENYKKILSSPKSDF